MTCLATNNGKFEEVGVVFVDFRVNLAGIFSENVRHVTRVHCSHDQLRLVSHCQHKARKKRE